MRAAVGAVRPVDALTAVLIVVVLTAHHGLLAVGDREVAHLIEVGIDLDYVAVSDVDVDVTVPAAARVLRRPQAHHGAAERDLGMIHVRVLGRKEARVIARRCRGAGRSVRIAGGFCATAQRARSQQRGGNEAHQHLHRRLC